MTNAIFQDMLHTIYATFGRSVPSQDIRDVLYGRVAGIPDEVAACIVERICDLERLPQNMSREFRNAWADWRAKNPTRIIRPDCPACGNIGVRHLWGRDERGRWRAFSVPCPACQSGDGSVPVPLRELERHGALVMPPDYPGGPVAFDRDNGLNYLWPADLDTASPRTEMRVGVDMRPDARRTAHLPELEREENAA